MDGVLIDSEKFWTQAEYEVFSEVGVKVTEEQSAKTKSMTTSEVTKFWYQISPWENYALEVVEQMVISRVIELIQNTKCEIPGAKLFIEELARQDYKIGLATNSPNRIIPKVLNKLNADHLFHATSSSEFEEKGKPDPSIYLTTAEKLNVDPINCLVFEDSNTGITAAKKAGMTVVGFTNGNRETNLENADYIVDSFLSHNLEII